MAYAIGIMSGTSLDGIDVALVDISGFDESTKCQLIHYASYPYDERTQFEILQASQVETSNVASICALNFKLGQLYSDAVTQLLNTHEFTNSLEFIALHGQTIHHLPPSSTLQIGDPARLAFEHKTTVVSNFRAMDIIAGGNGAPLVPYTEYILLQDSHKNRLLQNIGGIGNVTVLRNNCDENEVVAFDTGPGNMMINAAMMYFYQKQYDHNGMQAREGSVIPELLSELQNIAYFNAELPKTTGRELFGESFVHTICERYKNSPANVITTFTELTAWSIAHSYRRYIEPEMKADEMIVSGGGAYNLFLMERLQFYLYDLEVLTQEEIGLNSDAKEAIAFAILGNQTMRGRASNLRSATGAHASVILGNITPNPWGSQ